MTLLLLTSHSVTYFPTLIIEKEIKEKKIEKKIYIDLAMVASQWSEVAVYNSQLLKSLQTMKYLQTIAKELGIVINFI